MRHHPSLKGVASGGSQNIRDSIAKFILCGRPAQARAEVYHALIKVLWASGPGVLYCDISHRLNRNAYIETFRSDTVSGDTDDVERLQRANFNWASEASLPI